MKFKKHGKLMHLEKNRRFKFHTTHVSVPNVGELVPSVVLYVGNGDWGGSIGAAVEGFTEIGKLKMLGLNDTVGEVVGFGVGARVPKISSVGEFVAICLAKVLALSSTLCPIFLTGNILLMPLMNGFAG